MRASIWGGGTSSVCSCVTVATVVPREVPDLDDAVVDLQRELLALLPEHIRDLRSALTLVVTDQAARVALQRLGHRLGGTAATVRLAAVGDVGRAIERFARGRVHWTVGDVACVSAAVDALDAWVRQTRTTGRIDLDALVGDPRVRALSEVA